MFLYSPTLNHGADLHTGQPGWLTEKLFIENLPTMVAQLKRTHSSPADELQAERERLGERRKMRWGGDGGMGLSLWALFRKVLAENRHETSLTVVKFS